MPDGGPAGASPAGASPAGARIRRALAEWPLLAAALALFSLALIPRLVRTVARADSAALKDLRTAPASLETEAALRSFLEAHPRSAEAPEARLLLARSIVARARSGDFPGAGALDEAWALTPDPAVRESVARELLTRGLARQAVDRYTELADELGLARALGRLAEREPQAAPALLDEASKRAGKDPLALAEIYRRAGRASAALEVLDRVPTHPAVSLERARALAALGRETEAFMAATDAAEDLPDGPLRHQARLLQATLQRRKLPDESPLAPLADLVVTAGARDAEGLRSTLSRISHPAFFDENGFDFAAFYRTWRPETPAVLREVVRLYPASPEYRLDLAAALRRSGLPSEAAGEFVSAGDLRQAAETAFEGALYDRAADLYGRLYESDRARHGSALTRRGESLAKAGRTAEALQTFAQAAGFGAAADRRRAVVLRGMLLAELGRRVEAAKEFERVLRDPDLGAEPRDPEWTQALLERGRALLDVSRPEARRSLEEYVERVGEGASALEAAYLLLRAEVEDKDWAAALDAVDRVEKTARGMPESGFLKEARFLKGDLLAALGRWEEAERAYAEAYRAYIDTEDRLWGLIGRARALARLDRRDEARRALERGRALYQENRQRYDRSFAGHGARAWGSALDELAKELR